MLSFLLCTFSLLVGIASGNQCHPGWILYQGKCYGFGGSKVTWPEALAICNAFGGSLATIESPEENSFLKTQISHRAADNAWVGGNDLFSEGQWVWASTGTAIQGFSDWDSDEPNNYGGNEDCLTLRRSEQYRWNDAGCRSRDNFICEADVRQAEEPQSEAIRMIGQLQPV